MLISADLSLVGDRDVTSSLKMFTFHPFTCIDFLKLTVRNQFSREDKNSQNVRLTRMWKMFTFFYLGETCTECFWLDCIPYTMQGRNLDDAYNEMKRIANSGVSCMI
jgi:hypothetical protein